MYSSEGGDVKGVASFTDDDDDLLSIHAKPESTMPTHTSHCHRNRPICMIPLKLDQSASTMTMTVYCSIAMCNSCGYVYAYACHKHEHEDARGGSDMVSSRPFFRRSLSHQCRTN